MRLITQENKIPSTSCSRRPVSQYVFRHLPEDATNIAQFYTVVNIFAVPEPVRALTLVKRQSLRSNLSNVPSLPNEYSPLNMKNIIGFSAEFAKINNSEISSNVVQLLLPFENVRTSHASCPGNQNIANTATMDISMRTTLL